jgi:hypothetical protein
MLNESRKLSMGSRLRGNDGVLNGDILKKHTKETRWKGDISCGP